SPSAEASSLRRVWRATKSEWLPVIQNVLESLRHARPRVKLRCSMTEGAPGGRIRQRSMNRCAGGALEETASGQREAHRMVGSGGKAGTRPTRADVLRICGELIDWKVQAIIASGASVEEIEVAA